MARQIIVFAGAGASKAVNPSKYPTTREFPDRLPEYIRLHSRLYAWVTQYINQGNEGNPIDIERILLVLHEIRDFLETATQERGAVGGLLRDHGVLKYIGLNPPLVDEPEAEKLLLHTKSLIKDINSRVHEVYRYIPCRTELENNWLKLLRELLLQDRHFDIFTTNYDLVIETAILLLYDEKKELEAVINREPAGLPPKIELSHWRQREENYSKKGLLTKLHGSINWYRTGNDDTILVRNPPEPASEGDEDILIYPGFKGVPTAEPYTTFHQYFEACLGKTSAAIFIGYAFRDDHINSLIKHCPRKLTIIVVNFDNVLPRIPVGLVKHKIHWINEGFGSAAIKECIKLLPNVTVSWRTRLQRVITLTFSLPGKLSNFALSRIRRKH